MMRAGQLEAEHLMKMKEQEVKQMMRAQERQAIFGEAFETEIQQYKQSGIIPSIVSRVIFHDTNFKNSFAFLIYRTKYTAKGDHESGRSRRGRRSVLVEPIPRRIEKCFWFTSTCHQSILLLQARIYIYICNKNRSRIIFIYLIDSTRKN